MRKVSKLPVITAVLYFSILVAVILTAGQAKADANSYLRYLNDNHVNTGFAIGDGAKMDMGLHVCKYIRAGMSFEQINAIPHLFDMVGVYYAAQHELCPETL